MKQKIMKKNQELVKYGTYENEYAYNDSDYNDNVVTVLDKNGVSLQPVNAQYKQNKYLAKDVRISKYGIKPYVCYPDTDFLEEPKVVKVVKKYNTYEKEMQRAKNALSREANRVSNKGSEIYENEMMKIRLTTEKNLLVAKIDSLRLTNKAMIIEKDYNENYTENARHKQVVKDIEKLKNLLLENNDINLKEKITEINLNRELELDNAKSNKEKISERISEQMEINKVKNEFMKERIRILSTGETPANYNKEQQEEIKRVREIRKFREKDDEELKVLYSSLKRVDIDKISNKSDRDLALRVIEKFESDRRIKNLHNDYMKENENKNMNSGKINTIRSRLFKIINKKYSANIDNELQKKIIVSAKKDVPFVSISVEKLLATQQRSLHAYFDEYPSKKTKPSTSKKSKSKKASSSKKTKSKPVSSTSKNQLVVSNKKSSNKSMKNDNYYVNYFDNDGYTSFDLNDEFFAQKAVKDAIRKWKKIEHHVETADDFDVDNFDKDSYKIRYLERERNSKKDKENFLNFLLEKQNQWKERRENNKTQKDNKQKVKKQRSLLSKDDNVLYYSEFKLRSLRRRLEKLPSDPIVFNSKNSYEYKNLMDLIVEFSQLSLKKLPKNPENDAFIIEVKQIIDFYDLLAKEDKIARQNIDKSMQLDSKLRSQIVKQDARMISKQTHNESRYQKEISKIEQRARVAQQEAERLHGRKVQQINRDIEWQRNNEENLHEKNKAFIKKTSQDLQKRSYIYENHQIDSMVHEINKFNARQKDERNIISLHDMPSKIECYEPLINGKIDLVQQEDGVYAINRVYSRMGNKEYVGKTLNVTVPNDVSKVVVLDKFRNIQNPLVRAAALKELAEVNYNNAVQYNLAREKQEINKANKQLEKIKEYSDSLVDDAYELNEYLELVRSKSAYSSFVQKQHEVRSDQKWKITEANLRRQYHIENEELKRLEHRNKKLELAQRRIENRRQKYLTSMENDLLLEIKNNESYRNYSKKQSSLNTKKENSLVPYSKSEKSNKTTLTQRFLSLFRIKKDEDIDEIIGKK